MFGFFERKRLIKKGLASGKVRRRRTRSEFLNVLETSMWVRVILYALFCAGLAALIFYNPPTEPGKKFLIGLLIFLTALGQLWINHPNTFASNSRITLMFGTFLVHLVVAKFILELGVHHPKSRNISILSVPFAFAPLVLSVLMGKNQGVYAAVFVSLWGSVVFSEINPNEAGEFMVTSLITGFIAVFVTLQVRRRSRQ